MKGIITHEGAINTAGGPDMCQLRAPLRALLRVTRELLGTRSGGLSSINGSSATYSTNTVEDNSVALFNRQILRALHCIRNKTRMLYRNRPQQNVYTVATEAASVAS